MVTVYGGTPIEPQVHDLHRGVDFFVGTTGRVLDHINRGNIDFSGLKSVVLDEADQMLKLGFKEDVESILSTIKRQVDAKDLQTCLFSATIPSWVRDVAREHLKRNFRIVDLAKDLKNKTAQTVNHLAINCPYHNRLAVLADLLVVYAGDKGKTIVFTQTKADANALILSDKIKQDIEVMHGDIAQNQREVTLKRFKEGKFSVLVATDVASRGLDIPNVDLVIQIEPPQDTETYIHRSGRTARAGNSGTCITFFTKKSQQLVQQIEERAGIKLKLIGAPQPEDVIRASSKDVLKKLDEVSDSVLELFSDAQKLLVEKYKGDKDKAMKACLAVISGHYQMTLVARSLLSGQEKMTTLEMSMPPIEGNPRNIDHQEEVMTFLRFGWPPKLTDNIRVMKVKRDMSGVLFDLWEDRVEQFMDYYNELKVKGLDKGVEIQRCSQLPELEDDEEGGFGGGWRAGNANGGGYGVQSGYGGNPRYQQQNSGYGGNGGGY